MTAVVFAGEMVPLATVWIPFGLELYHLQPQRFETSDVKEQPFFSCFLLYNAQFYKAFFFCVSQCVFFFFTSA